MRSGIIIRVSKELDDMLRVKAKVENKSINQASRDLVKEYHYFKERQVTIEKELEKMLKGGDMRFFK